METRTTTLLTGLFLSTLFFSTAQASCPISMEADKIIECISIENDGEDYHHWQKEYALIGSGLSREDDKSQFINNDVHSMTSKR